MQKKPLWDQQEKINVHYWNRQVSKEVIENYGNDNNNNNNNNNNNTNNNNSEYFLIHPTFIDRLKQNKLKMAHLGQRNSVVVPDYIQN